MRGFPGGSNGKESTYNVGELGLILGLGRCLGGGHGNPLQYFCLENPHWHRSLVSCSPWRCRVGHNWATKHKTTQLHKPIPLNKSFFNNPQQSNTHQCMSPHQKSKERDFPSSPVVKNLPISNAGGAGSIPDWGTNSPHPMWRGQKIKRLKKNQLWSGSFRIWPPRCLRFSSLHFNTYV